MVVKFFFFLGGGEGGEQGFIMVYVKVVNNNIFLAI